MLNNLLEKKEYFLSIIMSFGFTIITINSNNDFIISKIINPINSRLLFPVLLSFYIVICMGIQTGIIYIIRYVKRYRILKYEYGKVAFLYRYELLKIYNDKRNVFKRGGVVTIDIRKNFFSDDLKGKYNKMKVVDQQNGKQTHFIMCEEQSNSSLRLTLFPPMENILKQENIIIS